MTTIAQTISARHPRWYVLHVKNADHVIECLKDAHFEYYQFLYRERRPRKPPVVRQYFPGYLFVRFDVALDDWRCIPTMRGVRRLFSITPEKPLPLPEGLMDWMIAHLAPYRPNEHIKPIPVGSIVTLLQGPFGGFTAECITSDEEKVRVRLTILGRSVDLTINREQVQRA